MKLSTTKNIIFILVLILVSNVVAAPLMKPMPPKFSYQYEPEKVLREYPLGLINKKEAFAHHGGPVRKIQLPNGNEGWLYATGEEAGIPEIYILQFSNEGLVIDVMHKSMHFKDGHSAMQLQFLQGVTPQLKASGPGSVEK